MIFGIIFFVLYIVWAGFLWSKVLHSVFGLCEKYINIPLGIFASVIFLSLGASVFVVWYKINWIVLSLVYIVGAVVPFIVCKKVQPVMTGAEIKEEVCGIFPKRKFLFFCFWAISILQITILILCQVDTPLTSPWQTVHPWYLYNFFLLTILLVVLLFSRISFRTKFLFVIAYSLVLHLYLPLAHAMPWGGDVWRMIGVEQKLASGQAQLPVLPQALWNPYKYTYGQMWGVMALFTKTTGISLIALHRWFMPIVWGMMVPILGFTFGRALFSDRKKALALATLTTFPFALQAIGSITVSVSLGFLTLLLALALWLLYLPEKTVWQKRIVFALGILMCFGYALHAIIFWFVMLCSYILKKFPSKKTYWVLGIFSVLLFPLLDLVLGFSHLPPSFSLINFFKQIFGQFGGWYFARPITDVEIASANILFNHITTSAYVANIFSAFRWPVIFITFCIGLALVQAAYSLIKRDRVPSVNIGGKSLHWHVLGLLFVSVVGGYIIGWYILTGDRVFVRRLDSIFAFLLIIFTLYGVFSFTSWRTGNFSKVIAKLSNKQTYIYFFIFTFIFSFIATTIYATGPDVRVMSRDEYMAAKYIFTQEKENPKLCVLSDTWILLALEGASSGNIVGGGFPIGNNFGQQERVKLYNEFLKNPDIRILPAISQVMPVPFCYVALSRDKIDPRTEQRIHDFLGNLVFKSGPVLVWKMELKNS